MSFLTWVDSLIHGPEHVPDAQAQEIGDQQQRQAQLQRTPETYYGTSEPVRDPASGQALDPSTGQPFARTTGGTESHEQSGWSWLSEQWRHITGQTTTTSGVDNQTGQATTVRQTDRTAVTVDPNAGSIARTTEQGTTSQVLDTRGMAGAARRELQARIDDPATSDADKDRLRADLARIPDTVDEGTLQQVIAAHRLQIRPQYRDSTGDTTTTSLSATQRGVGGSVAGQYQQTVTGADGARSQTTASGSASADAYRGTASMTGSVSQADRSADGSRTDTSSVSATGSIGASQGQLTAQGSRTISQQQTDADGRVVNGQSDTQTRGASIVGGDRGTGVGLSSGSDRSSTSDYVTTRTQDQRSVQVTDRGVYGSGSTTRSMTGRTLTGQVRSSADGSFTVNITQVSGAVPPQYQVVMQLSASAGATLSGGNAPRTGRAAEAGGRDFSATGGATGRAQLTFTHVMDEAQARQYMNDVDQADAGGAAPSHPEFGLIGRLRALTREGGAGVGAAAVLGSSEAGAMLGDGESMELSLSGDVNVGGSVGASRTGASAASASVGGTASAGATRTVRIERTAAADAHGRQMVDVTVTFITRDAQGVSASGTYEGVTAGGSYNQSETNTHGAMVRLDTQAPDYADRYAQVCAAMSVDEVRALATRFTQGHSETSGGTGSVGMLGVTVTGGSQGQQSETTTQDRDTGRITGTVSGGRTDSASVGVGSGNDAIRPLQASQRDTATTTVDAGGSETTLETERASSDPLRAVREGWNNLTTWWHGPHTAGDTAAAVTQSPQERLRAQLETTYSELEQYSLSEQDVRAVADRAADTHEWDRMNNSPRLIDTWRAFGAQIHNPPVDAAEAAINATDAMRLARGRVMARWMSEHGSEGMDLIVAVLRYWQQHGLSVSSATDLGTHLEWPNSLLQTRTSYERAHGRVRMADDYLGRLVGTSDGLSRGRAWYDDTRGLLTAAEGQIQANGDFRDARAKLEMIDTIQQQLGQLDDAWTRNQHALETGRAESAAPAAPALVDRADATQSIDPTLAAQTPEQAAQRRRVADILAQLSQYKTEERTAFARARHLMPRSLHGDLTGTWNTLWNSDFSAAQGILNNIGGELHESWIARITELRGLYQALHTPADQWVVSASGGAPRNPEHEPDMDTLYLLYAQTDDSPGMNFTMPERRQIADNWRARWQSY